MTTAPTSLVLGDGRTVHFLGLGGTTTSALLTRVAGQIGGTVDAVVAFWGADWQRDIIVVAAGSDEQFRQLTRGPAGNGWTSPPQPSPTASIRSAAPQRGNGSSSPQVRSP